MDGTEGRNGTRRNHSRWGGSSLATGFVVKAGWRTERSKHSLAARRLGVRLSSERILEPDAGETREVAIRGGKHQAVFDREGGEVRVGDQIGAHAGCREELTQHVSVSLRRSGNRRSLAVEPRLHLMPSRSTRGGSLEDARVRDQTKEGEQARPGQPDARGAVQSLVEPGPRAFVLREVPDVGVDEQVCVDEDQRKPSPAPTASASATSSTLSRRGRRPSARAACASCAAPRAARCRLLARRSRAASSCLRGACAGARAAARRHRRA